MIHLSKNLKLPSTIVTTERPLSCPGCQCLRFEEQKLLAIDKAMGRTARYRCSKCSRSTLMVPKAAQAKQAKAADLSEQQLVWAMEYAGGHGKSKNTSAAYILFKKSASAGHPRAQYHLGLYYLRGIHVDQNLKKSRYWIQKSARQGHKYARQLLPKLSGLVLIGYSDNKRQNRGGAYS